MALSYSISKMESERDYEARMRISLNKMEKDMSSEINIQELKETFKWYNRINLK